MSTRKKYSKEFKLDAASLVIDQGYTRSEAARSLDISATMLGRWVRELDKGDGQAFRGSGMEHEFKNEVGYGLRCAEDGDLASPTTGRSDPSL